MKDRPRFLIVRIAALGDIAVATVLLTRIRAEHAGAHVTWLTGTGGEPLVRLFPGVDEVLTVNEKHLLGGSTVQRVTALASVWRQLMSRSFDRVLVVHADRRYRAVTLPLLTQRISALEHGVNPLPGRFRGDEYARLLDGSGSRGPIINRYAMADVRERLPRAATSTNVSRRAVAIAPGGARNILREDALRRWPVESYRALAQKLAGAGHQIVLIGDEGDTWVRRHFEDLSPTDHVGRLSLVETLCVLRDVDVLVSNDSGPLHFARLVRTPVVALFGPTDPAQMVGQADDVDALWGGVELACRPCYDGRNFAACSNNVCIQDVSVEAVFQAVAARLASVSSNRRFESGRASISRTPAN